MKAPEFRVLVERLGELSAVQREALVAALAGKGSANEAIALIETRFAAAPACGHCKSERFGPWGSASGAPALQVQGLRTHLQRADRHALGATPPPRCLARVRPRAGRWRKSQGSGQPLQDRARYLVPLAASLPRGAPGHPPLGRHRHCRGGRNVHPEVGQGLQENRRAGTQKARRQGQKARPFHR
jgi:hypothetical protein